MTPVDWPSVRAAVHVEWTKQRTVPGPTWLLVAVVALTVGLGVAAAATVSCRAAGCGLDPAEVSLTGLAFGQAAVVVLAVLVVGGEYGTGLVRVSLTAMPRRLTVLAAKAAVTGGLVAAAGTVAVLGSVVAGWILLPGNGFTAAHGYPTLSLADGPMLRAAVGSVLYLVLIGLLGIGIAAAVRDSAAAIGIVLGLLYLFPVVAAVVSDQDWFERLQRIGPMAAGLAVRATVDIGSRPIAPWAGLGVLAAWAAGALVAGGLVLRLRDA
jgi:ABC-2 type transport system permease protein